MQWLAKAARQRSPALLLLATAIGMAMPQAVAQGSPSPRSDQAVIQGVVLDPSTKPVVGALVHLEKPGETVKETTSDASGTFTFHSLAAGAYTLRATKSSLISKPLLVSLGSAEELLDVNLALDNAAELEVGLGQAKSPATPVMEFADKPQFTVAGVTDWTAAGGHGSDTSLRTSEALVRDTVTLSSGGSDSYAGGSPRTPTSHPELESRLKAALADSPRSFAANRSLGAFYLREANYASAVPLLQTSWQIDPADNDNEYDLALALQGAGDVANSRQHVEHLLVHHGTADLHRLAGELDEAADEPLAAVHEFEQAARLDPSELNYFEWGSELLLHRAVLQAEDVFLTGARQFPKSVRLLTALGSALFAAAKYDEAAQRLCEASDLSPSNPAPYLFMGKIQTTAPNPLPCIELRLKRFAESQPNNSLANYYYAMAVWKSRIQPGDPIAWDRAVALLKSAVATDPQCAEAYLQLGILYFSRDSFQEAIGYYSRAISANSELAEAHYRLAMAYDRTGELDNAKREFQLHDQLKKKQAAEIEQQRRAVKQFVVAGQPTYPVAH